MEGFEKLINILFESASHSCSFVPEEFHIEIFRGTLHYVFEKLCNGDMEKRKLTMQMYEKWSSHTYDEDDCCDDSDSE